MVDSALEPAVTAPAGTTPAVTNNALVVTTVAAPAAPAVSVWAKAHDEKAAITNPKASFFIVVPLYDANSETPCRPELCWGKTLNGKRILLRQQI
jgi:hypothetical protein